MNQENLIINGIPTLICLPETEAPSPLVFYIPGFGGHKGECLSLANGLAQNGIALVSFDPAGQGDRSSHHPAFTHEEFFYPPETGLDTTIRFFRVIEQCVEDVQTLMGRLAPYDRLKIENAGITGFSMGAYAAFLVFAKIPLLRAAVPMMGAPVFSRRWEDLVDECALSNPDWAKAIVKAESELEEHNIYIESIDPAELLLEISPRPVLAMNGDFDYDQPKYLTLDWVREACLHYREILKWKVYPTHHTVTSEMEADAISWFVQYLK